MYAMFGDEGHAEESKGRNFFIYGGVFVDIDELPALHEKIEGLRRDAGFGPGDSLKFATRTKPSGLSVDVHRELKQAVISLAEEHGVTFCAYVILHAIAKVQHADDIVQWGCNTVLARYNQFLRERDERGIVLLDRLSGKNAFSYAKNKFQRGLTFGRSPDMRLERVVGLGFTCDGATHLSSVADVVLGSFGYCVNEAVRTAAAQAMFPALVRLMWKRTRDGRPTALESGFNLRPEVVASLRYRQVYDDLIRRLGEYVTAGANG